MGEVAELPFGLATSVGPLPVDDVDAAVDLALATGGRFPTVPVLARPADSLLAQATADVPGMAMVAPGRLEVDPALLPDDGDPAVGGVDAPPFAALHAFLSRGPDVAADGAGLLGLRVALLGPVTLALTLLSAGVPPSRALVGATCLVRRRAAEVLRAVRGRRPLGVVALVLSEPGLVGAMHPTFPLTPSQVRGLLDPVVATLDASSAGADLVIGVHVPGRTDWATIMDSGVSLVSAPADGGLVGWADRLAPMLEAGGRVAWGAVPVDRPLGTGELRLWRRLTEVWGELAAAGVDPVLLRERSLVSPADGLAHFGPSQADRVLELTSALAERVRRQTIAARLPLGA